MKFDIEIAWPAQGRGDHSLVEAMSEKPYAEKLAVPVRAEQKFAALMETIKKRAHGLRPAHVVHILNLEELVDQDGGLISTDDTIGDLYPSDEIHSGERKIVVNTTWAARPPSKRAASDANSNAPASKRLRDGFFSDEKRMWSRARDNLYDDGQSVILDSQTPRTRTALPTTPASGALASSNPAPTSAQRPRVDSHSKSRTHFADASTNSEAGGYDPIVDDEDNDRRSVWGIDGPYTQGSAPPSSAGTTARNDGTLYQTPGPFHSSQGTMRPPLSSQSTRRRRGQSYTFDARWTAEEDRIVLHGRKERWSGSLVQKKLNKLGLNHVRSESAIRSRFKYLTDKRATSSQPSSTGASRSERQTVLSVASSPTPAGTRDAPIDVERGTSRSLTREPQPSQAPPSTSSTVNKMSRRLEDTIVEPASGNHHVTASGQLQQRLGGQTRLNFHRDKGKGKVQSTVEYANSQAEAFARPLQKQKEAHLDHDTSEPRNLRNEVEDTQDDIIHHDDDGDLLYDNLSHAEADGRSVAAGNDSRPSQMRATEGLVDREIVPTSPGGEPDETHQINPAEIDGRAEPHAPSRVTPLPQPGSRAFRRRPANSGQPTPKSALSTDDPEQVTSSRRSSGKLQRVPSKRLSSTVLRPKARNRTVYGSGGIRRDTYDIFTLDANGGQWEVPPQEPSNEGDGAHQSIEHNELPGSNGLASTGFSRNSPRSESRQSKWKFLVLSKPSMKRWQAAKKAAKRADETRSAYSIFLQEGWDDEMINAETPDERLRVQRWRKRFDRMERDISRKPQPPRNLRWPQYFPHHDRTTIVRSVIRFPADEEIDRFDDEATTDDEFRDDKMIIDWPTNELRPPLPATYRRLQINESDDDDEADSDEEPSFTDEVTHARWEERETARLAEMSMRRRGDAEEVDETSSSEAELGEQKNTEHEVEKAPNGVLSPISRISIPCFGFNERGIASSPGLSSIHESSRSQSLRRESLSPDIRPSADPINEADGRQSEDVIIDDDFVAAHDGDVVMEDADEPDSTQSIVEQEDIVSCSQEASTSPVHIRMHHDEELGDLSTNLGVDDVASEDPSDKKEGNGSADSDGSNEEEVAEDSAGEDEEDEKLDENAEVESSDREDSAVGRSPGLGVHEQSDEVGGSPVIESDDEDSNDEEESSENESPTDENSGDIKAVAREISQKPLSAAETSPLPDESQSVSAEHEPVSVEDEDENSSDDDSAEGAEGVEGDDESSSRRLETNTHVDKTQSGESTTSDVSDEVSPAASLFPGIPNDAIKHEEIQPIESDSESDNGDGSQSGTSDSSHESEDLPTAQQSTVAKNDSSIPASDASERDEEDTESSRIEAGSPHNIINRPGATNAGSHDGLTTTENSSGSAESEVSAASAQQKVGTTPSAPSQPEPTRKAGSPGNATLLALPISHPPSALRDQVDTPTSTSSSASESSAGTPTPKGQATLPIEHPFDLEERSSTYISSPPTKSKIDPKVSRRTNMAKSSGPAPAKAYVARNLQHAAPAQLHKPSAATITSSNITRTSSSEQDPNTALRMKKRHKKDKRLARLKRIHATFKANSTSFSDSVTSVSSPAPPTANIPTSSTVTSAAVASSAVSTPTVRRSNAMTSTSNNRKRARSPMNSSPKKAPRIACVGETTPSSQDPATGGLGIAAQIRALSARLSSPPAVRKKSPVPTLPPSFLTDQDDDDDESSSDSD